MEVGQLKVLLLLQFGRHFPYFTKPKPKLKNFLNSATFYICGLPYPVAMRGQLSPFLKYPAIIQFSQLFITLSGFKLTTSQRVRNLAAEDKAERSGRNETAIGRRWTTCTEIKEPDEFCNLQRLRKFEMRKGA